MLSEKSLHHRIQQTAERLQSHTPVDVERALANVRASAARRQKLQLFAAAAAALVVALALVTGPNIGKLLLSENLRPRPADDQTFEERDEESDRSSQFEEELGEPGDAESYLDAGFEGQPQRGRGTTMGGTSAPRAGSFFGSDQKREQGSRRSSHTERRSYEPTESVSSGTACWAADRCTGYVEFHAESRDRWVSISIHDPQSQNVTATIYLDYDGDGEINRGGGGIRICTATTSPIKIRPGTPVDVWVHGAGCANDGSVNGRPSFGEVVATFSSHR